MTIVLLGSHRMIESLVFRDIREETFHNESLNRVRDLFVFQAHLCYQVP